MQFRFEDLLNKITRLAGLEQIKTIQELISALERDSLELRRLIQSLPQDCQEKPYAGIKFSDEPDPIFRAEGLGGGAPLPIEIEAEMLLNLRMILKKIEQYILGFTKPQSARVRDVWETSLASLKLSSYKDIPDKLDEFIKNLRTISS